MRPRALCSLCSLTASSCSVAYSAGHEELIMEGNGDGIATIRLGAGQRREAANLFREV